MKKNLHRVLLVVTLASLAAAGSTTFSDAAVKRTTTKTIVRPAAHAPTRTKPGSAFTLSSTAMTNGGSYPIVFTCDGSSLTPPLDWSGAPDATKSYAIVMHHIPGPGDVHWYWVNYDISPSVTHLDQGAAPTDSSRDSAPLGTAAGTLGTNSVNGRNVYAPPCSKGPGAKVYVFTVYALSKAPVFEVGTAVSRQVLLDAIKSTTLGSATLSVTYDRTGKTTDGPPPTKSPAQAQ